MNYQSGACYGYARVSTQMQVEKGSSLEDQSSKIKAWCQINDKRLIDDVYVDAGVSGTFMFERPQFGEIMKRIGRGDILVAYDMSRVSRNVRDTAELIERLDEIGAYAVFIKDNINTMTSAGRLLIGVMSVIKQNEVDGISERVTDKMNTMRAEKKSMGRPPYGWIKKSSAAGSGLEEVPEQQEVITRIAEMREESLSYRKIADVLTSEGVKTPGRTAMRWYASTVSAIFNRGEVSVNGNFDSK